jgi:hypothetical protein
VDAGDVLMAIAIGLELLVFGLWCGVVLVLTLRHLVRAWRHDVE